MKGQPVDLLEACEAYQQKYGSVPTIIGIPPDKQDEAASLLIEAVQDDRPFEDDVDFYTTLDLDPPPDDDDVQL